MATNLEKRLEIKVSAALILVVLERQQANSCDVTAMLKSRKTGVVYAYACDELRACRLHYPEGIYQGSFWINKASFEVTEKDVERIRAAFPTMMVHQKQMDAREVLS